MILKHLSTVEKAIPVTDSYGNQSIPAVIEHDSEEYVLVVDSQTSRYYINKLKSRMLVDKYRSDNFEKIESDEVFKELHQAFELSGVFNPEVVDNGLHS